MITFTISEEQEEKLKNIISTERNMSVDQITENDIAEYLDGIIGDL